MTYRIFALIAAFAVIQFYFIFGCLGVVGMNCWFRPVWTDVQEGQDIGDAEVLWIYDDGLVHHIVFAAIRHVFIHLGLHRRRWFTVIYKFNRQVAPFRGRGRGGQ